MEDKLKKIIENCKADCKSCKYKKDCKEIREGEIRAKEISEQARKIKEQTEEAKKAAEQAKEAKKAAEQAKEAKKAAEHAQIGALQAETRAERVAENLGNAINIPTVSDSDTGCLFCAGETEIGTQNLVLCINKGMLEITDKNTGVIENIKIMFCPNCGAKLGGKK